jgi:hypothetical protein
MKGLNAAPVRITDDETGEWIEIKAVLSRGDTDWINSQLFAYRVEGDVQIGEVKSVNRLSLLLERAVVGWYLTDELGNAFPFSKANITKLPMGSDLVDRVLDEIAERNPIRRVSTESDETQSEE